MANISYTIVISKHVYNWIGMAYYIGENSWAFADAQTKTRLDMIEITHWMYIPELPESEVQHE